ncbi:MAG: EamA family transporter RarD [Actinomycetota bacterium]
MRIRSGAALGMAAYLLWGLFPLYFRLLERSGPFEIVAHRALWSLVFCALALTVLTRWDQVRTAARDRRGTAMLAAGGLLVAVNWTLYVWGVNTGRTLDAALGYYINPLLTALLGVLLLGERLRTAQWVAFVLGGAAVVVLVVAYGEVPVVAFGVATSFALYGLVKNRAGRSVPALPGLALETAAIAPLALAFLVWLEWRGADTVELLSPYGLLMATSGIVTAVPLLLFAAAAARIPLVTIGMIQYLTPTLQFLVGWLLFHEPMPPERWAGFVLVWIAVTLFAVDGARHHRWPRLAARRAGER